MNLNYRLIFYFYRPLSCGSSYISSIGTEVPQKLSHMPPQEENLGCHKTEIKIRSNLQIRETNDPVAKRFKMSLHVYLEVFGGFTSTMTENKAGNALSMSHGGL